MESLTELEQQIWPRITTQATPTVKTLKRKHQNIISFLPLYLNQGHLRI
jgi:hypothetical protein